MILTSLSIENVSVTKIKQLFFKGKRWLQNTKLKSSIFLYSCFAEKMKLTKKILGKNVKNCSLYLLNSFLEYLKYFGGIYHR